MGKKLSDKITEAVILTFLILFALSTLYPFVYFLACSLNEASDTIRGGFMIFPRKFTLENYKVAFQNKEILQAFKISVLITVLGTACSVMLSAMAAYALTFRDLPGRGFVMLFLFIPTVFGGGVVPTFILYRRLHLLTNILVYILPGLYGFFNLVVMRTFFEGIPKGLSEAAYIDGSSEMGIFFKIIIPLSGPIFATMILFSAVGMWNDWYTGAFFVSRQNLKPAATFLQQLLNEADMMESIKNLNEQNIYLTEMEQERQNAVTPESLRMTFVMIITLPIVCVYPFLQKHFVKGVMIGSIK
ncbi:MAG: carbohydrate ABC transporter permease [Ruminococcaceae bacterium]|nr:carbohydrate ABC transporter permease [Oscillospiraceae bacterium]